MTVAEQVAEKLYQAIQSEEEQVCFIEDILCNQSFLPFNIVARPDDGEKP